MNEKKIQKLEYKFNTNFHDYHFFKCFSVYHGCRCYFIVHDDGFEIVKFSMFTGGKKGFLKIFFEDIVSIDVIRKRFNNITKLRINIKSGIIYVFRDLYAGEIKKESINLVMNTFNNYKSSNENNHSSNINLVDYARLYEKGLLTLEEFENIKKKII